MGIEDYIVKSDKFEEALSISGLCFPCNACSHANKNHTDYPCNKCGHNLCYDKKESNDK